MSRKPLALLAGTSGAVGTRKIARDAHRIADLVFRVANRMRIHCVPRAIALRELLVRRGYAAEVRLGVLVRNRRVFGHAWVTIGNAIVGESAELTDNFAALPPAGLAGYATRNGIHWIRRVAPESDA